MLNKIYSRKCSRTNHHGQKNDFTLYLCVIFPLVVMKGCLPLQRWVKFPCTKCSVRIKWFYLYIQGLTALSCSAGAVMDEKKIILNILIFAGCKSHKYDSRDFWRKSHQKWFHVCRINCVEVRGEQPHLAAVSVTKWYFLPRNILCEECFLPKTALHFNKTPWAEYNLKLTKEVSRKALWEKEIRMWSAKGRHEIFHKSYC